jgi:hypothetical protein
MTRSLRALEAEILPEEYELAADSLAHVCAWELSTDSLITRRHTLEVASSYLIATAFYAAGWPNDWEKAYSAGLIDAGYEKQSAEAVAQRMTEPAMLRRALSLMNVVEDAPLFGLRIKKHMRYMNEPRFIYASIKLSN